MQTPQSNACASATNLAALMGQYAAFMKAVNQWLTDYNQNTWDTYWAQLPTAATNADGTIGAADGTPTSTHVITVPSGSPLNMTRNQLITAKALLSSLQTLYSQAGGTLTVPNQAPAQTAALIAPNIT